MAKQGCTAQRFKIRDSETPYQHQDMVNTDDKILTRLRPDGQRQPEAEAWVLIKINYARLGLGTSA